jgi:hypothetical protein
MKILIATLAISLICFHTEAQSRLRMTKAKVIHFVNGAWEKWPDNYTYFEDGAGPLLEISSVNSATDFSIACTYNGSYNKFTVSYAGYELKNDWYKYVDAVSDQVCIKGATLYALAQNGWPSNHIQVYLWIDSQDMAILLE